MLLEKIEIDTYKNRYLSEDMRSNKEVWIDEYSKRMLSDEDHQNILQEALKTKRIHSSPIVHIHEIIDEDDIIYIISDIPKGKKLHPLLNCNEKTVYLITLRLIRALLTLQRFDIKVHRLLPEQVYIDTDHEIQLLFERGMFSSSDQKNENGEIKSIGNILCFLIFGEIPNDTDNVEEKLKAQCSDSLSNLILCMLSDEDNQKFQRLEQIIPLVKDKREIDIDSIVVSSNIDIPVSHKVYRLLIIIFAVVFLYSVMYHPKSFVLEKISAFDKVRFHVLGYIGISEAQQVLGEIYEKGYGVDQDMARSIEWYRKAAQSGNVYSQMSLGHFYDQGIGVAIDKKQAVYWFTLAATNGDKVAKEYVAMLTRSSKEKADNEDTVKKEENATKQDDKNSKQDMTNNQALETIKNSANATVKVSQQNIQGNEIFIDAENVPVGGSGGLEITNNQTVAQSFTTTHRGRLLAIDLIDLKIHRCLPKESLSVSLVNIQNGQLGTYSFFTRELHPHEVTNTTRLYFGSYGPIVNPGEQYAVFLQTKANGCTYAWGGEYETYNGGETFISKIPNKRDMKFRSFIMEN